MRYATLIEHRNNPNAAKAIAVVDALIAGTITGTAAGIALAHIPAGEGRGRRDAPADEAWADPTFEPYRAFHPLDPETEAFHRHKIDAVTHVETKNAYMAEKRRMRDANA